MISSVNKFKTNIANRFARLHKYSIIIKIIFFFRQYIIRDFIIRNAGMNRGKNTAVTIFVISFGQSNRIWL